MAHYLLNPKTAVVRNPGFWFIIVSLVLITLPHYQEALTQPAFITHLLSDIGLTRHAFERILYLVPILLAGFLFGWKGSFLTSLLALGLMLPRVFLFSDYRTDAIFETFGIFLLANTLSITFEALRREREERFEVENLYRQKKESEEKYRKLFENAHDGIFLHDRSGKIVAANKACELLTGYSAEELLHMNFPELLSEESWLITGAIEQLLISGEDAESTIEATVVKKSQNRVYVHLSICMAQKTESSFIFQCTMRDMSDQKRMEENLRYYIRQATRAQEEERKRIALELHDETIQELVVLSRQLDLLATKGKELTPDNSLLLKDSQQKTKTIMQSLRHISQDLRPATLDRLGLPAALAFLAAETTKYSGIAAKAEIKGKETRLPEEIGLTLFRIAQEALRNAWKHSAAKTIEIVLEYEEQQVRLTVSDDGAGFKLPEKTGDLAKEGRLGIVGMQERSRLINGTFYISSEPGKGTQITVEVPFRI